MRGLAHLASGVVLPNFVRVRNRLRNENNEYRCQAKSQQPRRHALHDAWSHLFNILHGSVHKGQRSSFNCHQSQTVFAPPAI
jgi:hypothetical protein